MNICFVYYTKIVDKVYANEEFCTIEEFQNCLKLLQSVGSGESDLALPVNEDELESACMWAMPVYSSVFQIISLINDILII